MKNNRKEIAEQALLKIRLSTSMKATKKLTRSSMPNRSAKAVTRPSVSAAVIEDVNRCRSKLFPAVSKYC